MATRTVTQPQADHKPCKAYRAILFDEPGALTKLDSIIYFFSDAGALTEVEPTMCNFLTALGEMGLSETQQIMDDIHGGLARRCTSRNN